jgi:hypothetical protein
MWMIVDDCRDYGCDLIVRRIDAAKKILPLIHNEIEVLVLNHDLGQKETGYDLAVWALENNCLPNKVQVCSMNPVGKGNICSLLIQNNYKEKDKWWEKCND